MKLLWILSLLCCLAAVAAISLCVFTDRNDGLYLPLGLTLSLAGNALVFLPEWPGKKKKEAER